MKIKGKVSQNLDNLQNLLIKLTVKASEEKAWLLYEFPFSLNPGDKTNWRYCTFVPPPPPRVRVTATVKLSAAFLHDESSITKEGVRKCNSDNK